MILRNVQLGKRTATLGDLADFCRLDLCSYIFITCYNLISLSSSPGISSSFALCFQLFCRSVHLRIKSSQMMPFINPKCSSSSPSVLNAPLPYIDVATPGRTLASACFLFAHPSVFTLHDGDVCFFVNNRELSFLKTKPDLLRGKISKSICFFLSVL